MTKWGHLPNAKHIDFVLESVKYNPDDWDLAWVADWDPVMYQARDTAWGLAWDLGRKAAWDAAGDAARDAARDAAWGTSSGLDARLAAKNAILALIAYDDCAYMLDMDYEELKTYAIISENSVAILLLPAVKAFELIKNSHAEGV
jgi:hypothetical protein